MKKRRRKDRGETEDEAAEEKKSLGWVLNIAPPPDDPNAYEECQSVRFHKPAEVEKPEVKEDDKDKKEAERKGARPTDWRWGPRPVLVRHAGPAGGGAGLRLRPQGAGGGAGAV